MDSNTTLPHVPVMGKRSFSLIAIGLPVLVIGVVVAVFWQLPPRTQATHDHGDNLVHTHWHTHDVRIDHGHTHPGVTRITHSHEHEHGHHHSTSFEPRFGGEVVQIGHVHENAGTRTYWAEFAESANVLELHLFIDASGAVTEWHPAPVLPATLLVDHRVHSAVEFATSREGYRCELPASLGPNSTIAVSFQALQLEGRRFDFAFFVR